MPKTNPEDIAFFREQMRGIKPLKTDKVYHTQKPPTPSRSKINLTETPEPFPFSDHLTETVTSATPLSFAKPGIQQKVLRDLRLGKIIPTKSLDLHGATVEQARNRLDHFLTACLKQERRCVRIIHGKGKLEVKLPVLKNHVNSWLRQHPAVLAFCSAIPRDGGTGAVYILLKRM